MDNNSPVVIDDEPSLKNQVSVQQEQHMELMKIAVQSEGGVEKLDKLMDLQERWERNLARKQFFDSMAAFQMALPEIGKRGKADFGPGKASYSYAKIEDIAAAIREPLAENDLSYRFEQTTEQSSAGPFTTVNCIVTHKDGHSEKAEMSAYPDKSGGKNPIQELASTVSYLRRYTLTGALGITVAEEDNDGHGDHNDFQQSPKSNSQPPQRTNAPSGVATDKQIGLLKAKLSHKEIAQTEMCEAMNIKNIEAVQFAQVNECIKWIDTQ